MRTLLNGLKALVRFKDYRPQAVTLNAVKVWMKQFEKADQKHLGPLLDRVIYLSERKIRKILYQQNVALMRRLHNAGLSHENLIYLQVHDAGSSSAVMLNMLRDMAKLERLKCRFLDAHDSVRINQITNDLGEGALIYVDDFVGSGTQFCTERDFVVQSVVGTFAEFLLVPSICEEGFSEVSRRGIEVYTGHLHGKAERPLHDNCFVFDSETKQRLRDVCGQIDPKMPLGFKDLAAMVVLYRNAPNNVPVLLRGNINQTPYKGVFPRTTDLPF